MDKQLCGARGWVAAVKAAGAAVVNIHNRIVRGDGAALATLAKAGLTVEPHWGPRDPHIDDAAWSFITAGKPNAWRAFVAVGTLVE